MLISPGLKVKGFYVSSYEESSDFMKQKSVQWRDAIRLLLFYAVFSIKDVSGDVEIPVKIKDEGNIFEKLNPNKITTKWNDSYLFSSRIDALKELETLKKQSETITQIFRPKFENLSGQILLDYLETEKEFLKSIKVLYTYAYTQHSKNVNDPFFTSFLESSQNLNTEYEKANAFATVKLTSFHKEEWAIFFSEEHRLEM